MDPDAWCEPLNLSIKKKPIAVVAPSSLTENNKSTYNTVNLASNNMTIVERTPRLHRPFDVSDDEEYPIKSQTNYFGDDACLDLSKTEQNSNNLLLTKDISKERQHNDNDRVIDYNAHSANERHLNDDILKNISDSNKNLFKNTVRLMTNNNNDKYDFLFNKDKSTPIEPKTEHYDLTKIDTSNTDTIYSMINHLAEQKLLQALYVNSLLSQSGISQLTNLNIATPPEMPAVLNAHSKQYPILNNLLGSSRHPFENSDFYKSKTEALSIKVPSDKSLNLCAKDLQTSIRKEKSRSQKRATMDQKNSSSADSKNNQDGTNASDKKKPHIKKPLNAFMLYMKEMRAKVVAECTLKESAAINQILGRRWHSLSREEQAKYYEKARQERQLHMQLYPGWSARDNYGYGTKKKKRKKERTPIEAGGNSLKKCRARYGLDQQSQWCKPCRRKKKCIRYMEAGDSNDGNQSDDNLGSCGSVGDAQSPPDDDAESLNQSLSSPGGLSGLSSLTSPSMILPSPSTSLASPSVSLASPCMSLQSPLTPHDGNFVDCNKPLSLPTSSSLSLPSHLNHQPHNHNPPHRNPVGTNPHDINNPLSVNQLTGQCVKNSNSSTNVVENSQSGSNEQNRAVISVT